MANLFGFMPLAVTYAEPFTSLGIIGGLLGASVAASWLIPPKDDVSPTKPA